MKLTTKVQSIEKSARKAAHTPCCTVVYKDAQERRMSLQEAIQAATEGKVRSITFDLTKDEERGFHQLNLKANILEDLFSEVYRPKQERHHPLIQCSLPYAIVHADSPANHVYMGHQLGGYYVTENGEVFHQSDKDEFAEKHGIGFFICIDDDERKVKFQ